MFRFPKSVIVQHLNFFTIYENFPAVVQVPYDVIRRGRPTRLYYTFPLEELYLIYLRYVAVPVRELEVAIEFGRTIPEISRGVTWFQRRLERVSRYYLQSDVQAWFDVEEARRCLAANADRGCARGAFLGYVDGLNNGIPRPGLSWLQRIMYNGYKKRCGLNYVGVCLPNGLHLLFLGPSEGRRHDAAVAAEHGLYEKLE